MKSSCFFLRLISFESLRKKPLTTLKYLEVFKSTRSGNRTHTPKYTSLSRARLPIPPSGQG